MTIVGGTPRRAGRILPVMDAIPLLVIALIVLAILDLLAPQLAGTERAPARTRHSD